MTHSVISRLRPIDLTALADAFAPTRVIDRADLPEPLAKACRRILARVHALPWERAAFARELAAHARDAHDAGVPINRVVLELGTPRRVGRLIARAIRRKRSLPLGIALATLRAAMPLLVAFVTLYSITTLWYESRVPVRDRGPTLASLHAFADPGVVFHASPVPSPIDLLIHRAIADLEDLTHAPRWRTLAPAPDPDYPAQDPADWATSWPHIYYAPGWPPAASDLLAAADPIVRTLHEAAAQPRPPVNYDARAEAWDWEYHKIHSLLVVDAAAHAAAGDPARVLRDLETIAALIDADAIRRSPAGERGIPNLWTNLVRLTASILDAHPDLFDPSHLEALDRLFDTRFHPDFSAARARYAYALDRVYGPGDRARITPEGFAEINRQPSSSRIPLFDENRWDVSDLGTDLPSPLADRAEPLLPLIAYDRGAAQASFDHAATLITRLARQDRLTPIEQRQLAEADAALSNPRNPVALQVAGIPSVPVVGYAQDLRMHTGAMRLLIAAHRYRLDHAEYPACASDLVPSYIEAVPTDRFDGTTLRYTTTPEGPRLRALGPDLDDDGGSPEFDHRNRTLDGDWVLPPATHPAIERIRELRSH